MNDKGQFFGRVNTQRAFGFGRDKQQLADIKNRSFDKDSGEEARKKYDNAAVFVLAAGCFAILLFFLFGAFGKGVEPIGYSNYANDEHDGAVSVFSQIIYPDGRIEKSAAFPFDTGESTDDPKEVSNSSANAENAFSPNSEKWNFWQYLCDSLALIFGVTNAE